LKRSVRTVAAVAIVAVAAFDSSPRTIAALEQVAEQGTRARTAPSNRIYIVQMTDLPVATYTGGIAGQPATKPARGQKIDPNDPTVIGYAAYLDSRHEQARTRVGGGRKIYDYRYSFNGFAAELTEAQADALRGAADVVSVTKDEIINADTSSTPAFLGLDAPGGLWDQAGGVDNAGEDVIIGIIDFGIWPESESFSDRTGTNGRGSQDGKLGYQQIPGWHGKCTPGERFPASLCNQKLIGAQRFNEAWGGDAGLKAQRPWEFASARDLEGHGTHTASTAGGNHGVVAVPFSIFGSVSGIAPRARIAAYKALWSTQGRATGSGFTSDVVAAIDQAVVDGVDVINFSINGTQTNFFDPVQQAFFFAADAGIFVAAAAGNSGPTTGTVEHPSPWITTVAAGTHSRGGVGSTTLGNGATYDGFSFSMAVGPAPLIDSTAAGLPGADPAFVSLCIAAIDNGGTPVLDPAKVAGKIVVCDRGTNARVSKSLAVKEAGGVGMILVNVVPGSLNADFHSVPTVHLADTDRAAVKAYAAIAGATARINQATIVNNLAAPFSALFSSRGPLAATGGDVLKPDVIAPGQDIIAAVAPPGNGGASFAMYSGTSMAAPHVAGLAALLKGLQRDWTPMMIKSALMTSATDVLDADAQAPSTLIFRQGAGHVTPNNAVDPGLVYNSGIADWLAFLCGTTTRVAPSTCNALVAAGYSLDPSNLNVASIAIGDLFNTQTVKRTVTNVGQGAATYSVSVTGMTGFAVNVNPTSLTLNPGQSTSFTVTFTRTTAPVSSYTGGQLTWTDGTHNVRTPLVVRPIPLVAPASLSSAGTSINYNVAFGYTGAFTATPRGLIPATLTDGTVFDDPANSFSPTGAGVTAIPVTIPAGTTYARFSLFDAYVTSASDIDLYVFKGTTFVRASGGSTSREEVNLVNPVAGTDYVVYVHGYDVPGSAQFRLFSWLLGSADAGNTTVTAPTTATAGSTGGITLTFSGLTPGTKYLGSIVYSGASGMPSPTIVRVDP
jgi:subtilisin family serine protease